MYTIDLSGKVALVTGVANKRSLAWAIAQSLSEAGAQLILTYAGERIRPNVEALASEIPGTAVYECDVSDDASIASAFGQIREKVDRIDSFVHAIAFARKEDLEGKFFDTSREGFHLALDISAFSLLAMTRQVVPMIPESGGTILSLSYIAAQRAVRNYNVMGTAKASLEQMTRQLAYELGPQKIRVNAISAGPVSTLSARGISGFSSILDHYRDFAPLRRNITQEEVGTTGLFLCSQMSAGITGEVMYVDAGYNVMM